MKRVFKFKCQGNDWTEVSEIDTQTGHVSKYCEDDKGMRFSGSEFNLHDKGWKNTEEFIKNRRNKEWGWKEVA